MNKEPSRLEETREGVFSYTFPQQILVTLPLCPWSLGAFSMSYD